MLDTVACCKIRTAKSSVVDLDALRDLKVLLSSTRRSDAEFAIQAQHPYLLDAGGADVSVVEPSEADPTGALCAPATQTGLAGTVPRDATEDSAVAGVTAAAARRGTGRSTDRKGGAR